jgi:hypothetical protein
MPQYLLSVHACEVTPREPMTEEEMRESFEQVMRLEEEMRSAGAFVFGGRLHDPDTASVVRMANGNVVTTDGPFLESKEHLGGFYIITADDLDAALEWAGRVTELIREPIEVRPFAAEPEG